MVRASSRALRAGATVLACIVIAACGSTPTFVDAPPLSMQVPVPPELQGLWVQEGATPPERARVVRLEDGSVRLDLIAPQDMQTIRGSMSVRQFRFDGRDWLVGDLREWPVPPEHRADMKQPAFILFDYVREAQDRLCAIRPSANPFADAIKTQQLQGTVRFHSELLMDVVVTSSGEAWVNWWSALPADRKTFAQPVVCFRRIAEGR